MEILNWVKDNFIEIFGAVAGIVYVFLEIRQNIWLWPVGVVTSAVYIWVFFTGKLYADMSLQGYYLVISFVGWYWWLRAKGTGHRAKSHGEGEIGRKSEGEKGRRGAGEREEELFVTRLRFKTGVLLMAVFVVLYFVLWFVLSRLTDSPVPEVDSFITSLSVIATWMLARKIFEHWYLWIIVNFTATILFVVRGLYPTVILYLVYAVMSFAGLVEWRKSIEDSKNNCRQGN
jgi:nicotinamide mononucleotide transporter